MTPYLERRMFDQIGLALADRYAAGVWTCDFCDGVSNSIWPMMLRRVAPQGAEGHVKVPDLIYEVFLAFDAGECLRPGDPVELDPVAAYTNPAIARILTANRGRGIAPQIE